MRITSVKNGSTRFDADVATGAKFAGRPCIVEMKRAGRGNRFYEPGSWNRVKSTVFRSDEIRDQRMVELAESAEASRKYKAERKAERAKPHSLKVGAILVSSWGYDQTNVDFYVVTAATPKTVHIAKIASETVEATGQMSSTVRAVSPPEIIGETRQHRASADGYVHISSCQSAHPWDGRDQYCSWYA